MLSFRRRLLKAFTRVSFVLGHLFLMATLILWYLAETGRLDIAGLEPITAIIGAVVSYLGAFLGKLADNEQKPDRSKEWRNRKQLIQNVRAAWIHGVRDQLLHQSVWIELGLQSPHADGIFCSAGRGGG